MARLFGFDHLRLQRAPRSMEFGSRGARVELPPVDIPPRLFAFTTSPRGARCYDFTDDPDGHRALASHLRGENVVRVVRGHLVPVEHEDLLIIGSKGSLTADSQTLPVSSSLEDPRGLSLYGQIIPSGQQSSPEGE